MKIKFSVYYDEHCHVTEEHDFETHEYGVLLQGIQDAIEFVRLRAEIRKLKSEVLKTEMRVYIDVPRKP